MKYASGYSHLLEMSNYYVRLVIRGPYLNTFPRVFTCRLHVWNPVRFITSVIKAASVRSGALLDQHTLARFTAIGFSFHL